VGPDQQRLSRLRQHARTLLERSVPRYLFAVAMVAVAYGLRLWFGPAACQGAPLMLCFGAVMVSSLLAGVGPGVVALLLSLPVATVAIAIPSGGSAQSVVAQALLYGFDGLLALYVGSLTYLARRELQHANVELRKANDELSSSIHQTREIIELAPDAYFEADLDARLVSVNAAACRLLGFERDELLGKTILDVIPPRDVPRLAREKARLLVPGATSIGDWTHLRKDGSEVPTEVSSNILPGGRWQAFIRDISERKQIEREQQLLAEVGTVLSESLDYEQTLGAVALLAVREFADWCVVDVAEEGNGLRRLKVVSADPAKVDLARQFEQLPLDRDRPYLLRRAVEARQPVLIRQVAAEHLEAAAQSPEHLRDILAMAPVSMMALPLVLRDQLMGGLMLISSSTSRIYDQNHLRLAQLLAERAATAIQNARLYRASMRATVLRDQVLGVVAHDLRNPLTTISLQAVALSRRGPEPERRSQRPQDLILRAATRMNRLIQDLLDVAVVEAGRLAIDRAALSSRQLLLDAVEMQRGLSNASSLEIAIEARPDVPAIWGDADRLLQVFENLIGNAVKFTDAGGRISVGAAPREHDVLFWVTDTGRGIAPEHLPRVFDRFWQAAHRESRLGAGLGLPITKGIVEAHGGTIWVHSAPGKGTTFFFTVPTAAAAGGQHAQHLH
jgi:PAS domain S-box-containing protein